MRKFFILTLMVASLMMVSCVDRRNRVIIDYFVSIDEENDCMVKTDTKVYKTEGLIDLAFTFDYVLGFQVTNYIPSSGNSGSESSLTTAEANYFFGKWAEIDYEFDGSKLSLDQSLWNKKTRISVYGSVIPPNGSSAGMYVHVLEEAQAKNLLEHVNDIDWIASPLIIKVKLIGELADGTEITTNTLNYNLIPTFGTTIQMGSTYYIPENGYPAPEEGNTLSKEEYDAIMKQCAFNDALIGGGCFYGQDSSLVNCYAGDTDWERYIVETYGGTYIPGYAAFGVVEMIYNTYKKPADDNGYYACCPGTAPEAPEEAEEDNSAAGGSGSGGE